MDAAGVAASSTGIGDAAFAGACMVWSVAMPLKAIARIPHHTQGRAYATCRPVIASRRPSRSAIRSRSLGLPGDEAPRRLPPPAGEPAQPAESPGSGGTALESAIFGQVLDVAGEPLPGTAIAAAVAGAAPAARVEVADRQGEYRISNLPPGTYTVIFHLPGFRAVVRNEVVVGSGLAARVDAVLAVGMAVGTDEGVVRILPLGVDESVVSGPLGPPGDAALIR